MKILNEYGKQLQKDFEEHCRACGVWEVMYAEGTYVLESEVRGVKDYAAWCMITYSEDVIDTVREWQNDSNTGIAWTTNWKDPSNAFIITCDALLNELDKCFTEVKDDMSIQLTLTGEEIEQLEKIVGCDINDKETLHNVVVFAIKKYMEG